MYVIGQGHEHLGPGTSLVQRINWTNGQEAEMVAGFGRGFAGFSSVGEFRSDCRTMSPGCAEKGLGCAGCAGKCKSGCGLGLFDGGFDPSTFGGIEWAVVVGAGWMLASTVFATKRAAGRIAAIPGNRRKRKAARYRELASELTRKKK